MANPIWKDYYVDLGATDGIQFRICVGTGDDMSVIYTGKAYIRPGETSASIRINDICADYMGTLDPEGSAPVFSVQAYISTSQEGDYDWEDIDTDIEFIYDWSYVTRTGNDLSCPVKGIVHVGQDFVFSSLLSSLEIGYEVGGYITETYAGTASAYGGYLYRIDISELEDEPTEIYAGSAVYKVVSDCSSRYVLEYRNAFGGYDTLLIEGNSLATDTMARNTMQKEADNTVSGYREKSEYLNEITRSMVLHTGWMSDAESQRMHHLMGSTDVVLVDMEDGERYPVVITDTSLERRTYRNNGSALVRYDVNVEIARDYIRR